MSRWPAPTAVARAFWSVLVAAYHREVAARRVARETPAPAKTTAPAPTQER